MRKTLGIGMAVALMTVLGAGSAHALLFDQDVTNNVIFGTGNGNGYWTVDQASGIELGLRGKIPFSGVYNSNGDGTYSYALGTTWNIEWSINSNFDGTGANLDHYRYRLRFDTDPTQGVDFSSFSFDPVIDPVITNTWLDHSFGDNLTAQSAGIEATDAASYSSLVQSSNLVQQSWKMNYYGALPVDPNVDGTYTYYLEAFNSSGNLVASTSIDVIVGAGGAPVPEPATLTLLGLGLGGLGLGRLRKRLAR